MSCGITIVADAVDCNRLGQCVIAVHAGAVRHRGHHCHRSSRFWLELGGEGLSMSHTCVLVN
eukprot:9066902-Alexandrium_andersonii.AAC.1